MELVKKPGGPAWVRQAWHYYNVKLCVQYFPQGCTVYRYIGIPPPPHPPWKKYQKGEDKKNGGGRKQKKKEKEEDKGTIEVKRVKFV